MTKKKKKPRTDNVVDFGEAKLARLDRLLSRSGIRHFVLGPDGRTPQPATMLQWARWYENPHNRRIAHTDVNKDVWVSTIFLGLDHSFGFGRRPLLFETMIFGGPRDQYQERYSTYEEAIDGHHALVALCKAGALH